MGVWRTRCCNPRCPRCASPASLPHRPTRSEVGDAAYFAHLRWAAGRRASLRAICGHPSCLADRCLPSVGAIHHVSRGDQCQRTMNSQLVLRRGHRGAVIHTDRRSPCSASGMRIRTLRRARSQRETPHREPRVTYRAQRRGWPAPIAKKKKRAGAEALAGEAVPQRRRSSRSSCTLVEPVLSDMRRESESVKAATVVLLCTSC